MPQLIWDLLGTAPESTGPDAAQILATGPAGTVAAMLRDHLRDNIIGPAPDDRLDGYDWWFSTTLDLTAPEVLAFRGLTAPATVFVDGAPVATVTSTFLPLDTTIPAGRHRVDIRFGSVTAWLAGRRPRGRWRSTLMGEQKFRWLRTTLLGRAPTYGGIPPVIGAWRPITLSPSVFRDVTVTADIAGRCIGITGTVHRAQVDGSDDRPVAIHVDGPDGETFELDAMPDADGGFRASIPVPEPRLWWPRGYGAQPVHRLTLRHGDAVERRTCGFRDVEADSRDGAFTLHVNGIRVFCRGATWVPPDPVALTADESAIARQLSALAEAGATMVRIVGGLVYEQPEFFDLCAQLGILVWQDAMLATFDPPAEQYPVITAELAATLRAVTGNPALAVVSGGSETIQQPEMMGITATGRTIELIEEHLAETVAAIVAVPYVPSSPSRGSSEDLAIRPDSGVAHWFGVGGYLRPLDDVRSAGVRFATESLAFAIPPGSDAVERHFGTAAVAGHHPDWKAGVPRDRTASWDFEDVRDTYVREVFGVDPLEVRRTDPERYLQLGRLAVGEAMAHCYRFWRHPDSLCAGALVLTSRDMRPGAGWGLLDVDGDAKLPLAMLRRLWAPQAVIARDAGLSGIAIDIHNDGPEPLTGTLHLTAIDATGHPVVEGARELTVAPHSSLRCHDAQITGAFADLSHAFRFGPTVADAVVSTLETVDGQSMSDVLVVHPREGQVHAGLHAESRFDDGWTVTVTAATTLRYVCFDVPGWSMSDDCFHLAAGRSHTVTAIPGSGTDDARGPRGRVSSIDALGLVAIVGEHR